MQVRGSISIRTHVIHRSEELSEAGILAVYSTYESVSDSIRSPSITPGPNPEKLFRIKSTSVQ